jgi:Fur family ferric uptake transcriptional regulator
VSRRTEQRGAIRRAVETAPGPLRPVDVLAAARKHVPGLGIATVYRNLKTMVESGILQAVELPGEPSRYEIAGKKHHHHFRCDACDRVLDVVGCSRSIDRATPGKFEVNGHELLLYGRCPDCRPS